MKRLLVILLIILFFSQASYAKKPENFGFRNIETRIYDISNTDKVIKAVASTFQDSDFVIEEFEPELGFLRARKTFKQRYINKSRFAGQSFLLALATSYAVFTWGSTAAYTYKPARKLADELHPKNVVVDANITVEKFGPSKTRIRLTMVQKLLQNAEGFSYTKNAPIKVRRIYDENTFEEFFNQVTQKL